MDRLRRTPLLVDLVDASELVRAGLERMLAPYDVVVGADGERAGDGDGADPAASITLYDVPGAGVSRASLELLTARLGARRLVLYCWDVRPEAVGAALSAGAAGLLSKSLPAISLADALHRVAQGDTVVRGHPSTPSAEVGRTALTNRESQVLGLIASGMSNADIARATNLSINSVKTYIRGAYQKIGARNRAQALLWALEHGCVSDSALADPPVAARRSRRPDDHPVGGVTHTT